jgi:hypothetical protein
MPSRPAIPKAVRDRVLGEFNHRCAICGLDNPHLHHIDGNPQNNDPRNLLPSCPNHHLLDVHSPTAPIDPAKLQLFRDYKDPMILSAEFEPLFRRINFLLRIDRESFSLAETRDRAAELVSFVAALEMGAFYSGELAKLVTPPLHPRAFSMDTPKHVFEQWAREERDEYLSQLQNKSQRAIDLAIELLRYQRWGYAGHGSAVIAPGNTSRR